MLQNLQLHYRFANIQQIICAVEGDWNIYVRHINTTVLFKDIIILSNEFLFNHSLNYYYRDMTLMRQISQEKHKTKYFLHGQGLGKRVGSFEVLD